jgi:hypothetical protein
MPFARDPRPLIAASIAGIAMTAFPIIALVKAYARSRDRTASAHQTCTETRPAVPHANTLVDDYDIIGRLELGIVVGWRDADFDRAWSQPIGNHR